MVIFKTAATPTTLGRNGLLSAASGSGICILSGVAMLYEVKLALESRTRIGGIS
jgi:hypothetical protein